MKTASVLIVDDDISTIMQFETLLTDIGYSVAGVAHSGSEAVKMAGELNPDLILMDIVMPGELDGIDAAAKIKGDMDIPIVFLTGYSEHELLNRAKQIEPHGYILKPYQENQIRITIDLALFKKELERELKRSHQELERTVRKQTARLRRTNEQLKALLNATTDTAFLIGLQGNVIASNSVTAERFNMPLDKFLGSCSYDLMSPALAKARKGKAGKVIRTGKPCRFEDKRRGIIFDSTIYPVFDEQEKVVQLAIYGRDITDQRQAEEGIRDGEKELKNRTQELEETNAALKVLLKRRDEDRIELEEKVVANVTELVEPYLAKIKQGRLDGKQTACVGIIESNLRDIISPLAHKLSSKLFSLTPKEIRVAGLVKGERTTKEIAELMDIFIKTVEYHRDNIRKKLGIKNEKVNLRSRLISVQ